jgi:cell division septum initiation protein DivIVA
MSLLDNQTFKKKIAFVKSTNHDCSVAITINIQCNHDIDKHILADIEKAINDMFLKDYENVERIAEQEKIDKDFKKQTIELNKANLKQQVEYQKLINDQQKQQLNQQKDMNNKQSKPIKYDGKKRF